MPKDATINARVDRRLKVRAERVLAQVGVSTSEAVTMLLHQIVLRNGMPFEVRVPNAETRAALDELAAGGGERFDKPTHEVFERISRPRQKRRA
ncbi:RelB antitoxin [Hyphomicrobium denitrificans 1NES1]|uniref:RelB antitoxin n=1 Tax=Hyphomicrobium denitrificans 1NES1 TaxID=670307 RepID=N0B4D2_9HYPH|nr:type II toxin-antitoxin system RelB/DinJ family antitoxin [Hyphomicrobium denitrificans]AGK57062.1 RelB antitoxin [Hyphomicrobium denitrificans 1NES1]